MLLTVTAGEESILPSILTLPSEIQRSASRREHIPARAITFAIRSPEGVRVSFSCIVLITGGIVKG